MRTTRSLTTLAAPLSSVTLAHPLLTSTTTHPMISTCLNLLRSAPSAFSLLSSQPASYTKQPKASRKASFGWPTLACSLTSKEDPDSPPSKRTSLRFVRPTWKLTTRPCALPPEQESVSSVLLTYRIVVECASPSRPNSRQKVRCPLRSPPVSLPPRRGCAPTLIKHEL